MAQKRLKAHTKEFVHCARVSSFESINW